MADDVAFCPYRTTSQRFRLRARDVTTLLETDILPEAGACNLAPASTSR
jgi:hypothetical protein